MHRILILVSLLLGAIAQLSASNKVLDIGLFSGTEPAEIIVQPGTGSYIVYGNGLEVYALTSENMLRIKVEAGLVQIRTLAQVIGSFGQVEIKRTGWGNTLKVQRTDSGKKLSEYHDDFIVKPIGQKLRIINRVYIEHYVSGVVESEAGSKEPKEYYKVQAVICRTYALNNRRRHEAEGYQLCDKVHCQVYHTRSVHNPDIIKATQETIGVVIVDSDINLVTAAFHSNCGGYTCNSEDVWSNALGYLRERQDDNCDSEPHSYWRHAMPASEWLSYVRGSFNYPIHDPDAREALLTYCPERRQHRLQHHNSMASIDFKKVRSDYKLKSAYFSIEHLPASGFGTQDSVILEGKGYGHGVGLCQEGAMNMAKRGFSYAQILHYYYHNVHLVNLSVIDFFRSD